MAIDTTKLVDYSWPDIQKAAKAAMMSAALGGGTLTINGRTIQRVSIADARSLYELASDMIAAEQAGEAGSGNVLVNFRSMS